MTDYSDCKVKIGAALTDALTKATEISLDETHDGEFDLPKPLRDCLDQLSDKADSSATAAFTNVVTGLAIKVAYPAIDVRYHQIQIQDPAHFNHRGISETVVYPFLRDQDFDGAKSGWQTRTLERPKPYLLSYDENIRAVKSEFLQIYHDIEDGGQDAFAVLCYLMLQQIVRRNAKDIELIEPRINDIGTIVSLFTEHFFARYGSSGASRLPVLALHSLYSVIMPELKRFDGLGLAQLELHSAADSQTGATGDIEIKSEDGGVFEAIEVKHNIPITLDLVEDAARKLISRQVDRYYILTTHQNCNPDEKMLKRIKDIKERTGCQLIVNGIIPSIRYYLRLVEKPKNIFPFYVKLLKAEKSISHEHRVKWNEIVLQS